MSNSIFETMTKEEALGYCHTHRDEYIKGCGSVDEGVRQYDCLVGQVEGGSIEPSELPSYGMDFEEEPVVLLERLNVLLDTIDGALSGSVLSDIDGAARQECLRRVLRLKGALECSIASFSCDDSKESD